MKLYLVTGSDDDGENLDLFVRAKTKKDAVAAWRTYFDDALMDKDDKIDATAMPDHVFEVPIHIRKAGAINWSRVRDCR